MAAGYEKAVRKALSESGCQFIRRGKGDHDIWHSPITNKNFPVDGTIKSRHIANAVMRQSGVDKKF